MLLLLRRLSLKPLMLAMEVDMHENVLHLVELILAYEGARMPEP